MAPKQTSTRNCGERPGECLVRRPGEEDHPQQSNSAER
jgi:hypothetical protein